MKVIARISLFLLIALALISSVHAAGAKKQGVKKVRDMNVLIPQVFEGVPQREIQFDMEAFAGCYQWKSSNNNHVSLKQIPDEEEPECASICKLYLKSSQDLHNVIWITATDLKTQDNLRIEANIRKVVKIEILTKFRTIDVGDIQIFELIGYDEEGNSFSTLEGLKFDWNIKQADNFLEFVPLKDSQIQTTQLRKDLESFHNPFFFTDMVAVIGKKTGKTFVTATLKEGGYLENISHTVQIHVIEQFIVFPYDPIRLMKDSHLAYTLFYKPKSALHQQDDHYSKIALPSANYNWAFDEKKLSDSVTKVHKEKFASLYQDQLGSKPEGLLEVIQSQEVGKWQTIFVKDMRSEENVKKVVYTVVEPHHIDIQIKEFVVGDFYETEPSTGAPETVFENSWHLVKQRQYYIRAEVYDESNQLIYIAPNNEIRFEFDSNYFTVAEQLYRGQIVLLPKKLGKNLAIKASLKNYSNIYKEKKAHIVLPLIMITPTLINLPTHKTREQQYYLKYLGGSGEISLVSENNSVVQVSESSAAIVSGKYEGVSNVVISDKKNQKNFVRIKVEVGHVQSVRALEEQKEIMENEVDYIFPIAVNAKNNVYSNCTVLDFDMMKNEYAEIPVKQEVLNYEQLIAQLAEEAKNYKFMAQLLQIPALDTQKFSEYINDGQITSQDLQQIHVQIHNFGVCRKLDIRGTQLGNQIVALSIIEQQKRTTVMGEFYRSFDLKVLRKYQNVWKQEFLDQQLVSLDSSSGKNNNNNIGQRQKLSTQNKFENADKIVLTPGSSFQWDLEGGIDVWPKRNFEFVYSIISGQNLQEVKEGISFTQHSLNTTFVCDMPKKFVQGQNYFNDYQVQLHSQNNADLRLPKPKNLDHFLSVSCDIPSSIHIYEFNSTSSRYSDEYREKLSSYDMLYMKNNQINFLKVKAFDKDSKLFFNYTSLKFDWTLSNNDFGSISSVPEQASGDLDIDVFQQFQSDNKVSTTNQDLILKVSSVSFKHHKYSFNEVYDQVGLRILNNVKLVPETLRIYYYDTIHKKFNYNIEIVDGFGPFMIGQVGENTDSKLIDMVHSSYRNIQITPYKLGQVLVYADDFKTLGSERASSKVIVDQVLNLIISLEQNLVPEFNRTFVQVKAVGEFDQEFHLESYQYMDLHLEAELVLTSGKTEADHIVFERSAENPNMFSVEGKRRGLYKITAILAQNKQTVLKSNHVELEVFTKLWTEPPKIIMAPGCELGLKLKGGPSDLSNLLLKTTDLKGLESTIEIIEIEEKKLFIVKAKKIFNKEITFSLHQGSRLLTEVTIPVRIEPINRVKIVGTQGGRKLHLGTQIRLIAELYNDDHIMNMQVCDHKIQWESESENVLRLFHQDNIYPQNSEFSHFEHQKNFQLAINTSAIAQGKSLVSFTLYTNDNTLIKSTTKQIDIIPHLSHNAPTYIAQEDISIEPVHTILLMPPNSRFTLHPNKEDMTFQLFNTNSVEKGKEDHFEFNSITGEIYARTNKQRVTATIKVHDQEQNEFMSINVQTANIVSIFVQNSHQVFRMPQEKDTQLRIHLQDSLGRSFPTGLVGVKLGVQVTNSRVIDGYISLDLKFLHLKSKSAGFSLVKVYLLENPSVYDIFRINVGSVITPESPINVVIGGLINFKLSDKSVGQSQLRNWQSKNNNVLSIDSINGSAKAVNQGEVIVEATDGMTHQARVVVSKIYELLPEGGAEDSILTDMTQSRYYQNQYELKFSVIIQEPNGHKSVLKNLYSNKMNYEINNDIVFFCEMENKNDAKWFTLQSHIRIDEKGNQYPVCIVQLPPLNSHQSSNIQAPDHITITATLKNSQNIMRFQQRFDYQLQWLFKSREYNKNNQNKNNNQNNGSSQQQNENRDPHQFTDKEEKESASEITLLDHITILFLFIIAVYYYMSKNGNRIDFSIVFYVLIIYLAYIQFVRFYFASKKQN